MTPDEQEAYLVELRGHLQQVAAPHPEESVRIDALRVVDDAEYPEVEVVFQLAVEGADELPALAARVPFAADWLWLTGREQPSHLADDLWSAMVDTLRRHVTGAEAHERALVEAAPPADELWPVLLGDLGADGVVHEVGPGRLHVHRDGLPDRTVVITPDQWREVWAVHVAPWEGVEDELGEREEAAGRGREDPFLVHHRGFLMTSVREELPPVSGAQAESAELGRRFRDRGGVGWFAYTSGPPAPEQLGTEQLGADQLGTD